MKLKRIYEVIYLADSLFIHQIYWNQLIYYYFHFKSSNNHISAQLHPQVAVIYRNVSLWKMGLNEEFTPGPVSTCVIQKVNAIYMFMINLFNPIPGG
jgi:hypothetical protein